MCSSCIPMAYTKWHDGRFEDRKLIGRGSFGEVYSCRDTQTDSHVAVKCILFHGTGEGLPSVILREISVLKELDHRNVVRIIDVIVESEGVKIVLEYLNSNLDKFIKDADDPMDPLMIKALLSQILQGVSYCHSQKILHRDLKPENLLLDLDQKALTMKIADFGSTRTFDSALLEYSIDVTTIPYKAPELLLIKTQSTTAVDIWAVGCIFAEMVMGKRLFPQSFHSVVLWEIIRILGVPSEEEWEGVTAACLKFCSEDTLPSHKLGLSNLVADLEPDGVDLLSKMLSFLPSERISACDALQHPYFYH